MTCQSTTALNTNKISNHIFNSFSKYVVFFLIPSIKKVEGSLGLRGSAGWVSGVPGGYRFGCQLGLMPGLWA